MWLTGCMVIVPTYTTDHTEIPTVRRAIADTQALSHTPALTFIRVFMFTYTHNVHVDREVNCTWPVHG